MIENPLEALFNLRYNIIYYSLASIVLFFVLEFFFKNINTRKIQNILLPILLLYIIFLFGFRTIAVGTDTANNVLYFTGRIEVAAMSDVKDIGLYLVSAFVSGFTKEIDIFLTVLAILYIVPIYIGVVNLKLKNPLVFVFFILSFFFFKSMGINTQRQGIAFALFFCAVTYYLKDKKLITYGLFAVAFMFHASLILPISAFIFSYKLKDIKLPLLIYFVATLLSIANFKVYSILEQIPIVNILVEERLDTYANVDKGNYRIGFRPDFWIFNTIFLVIGYYSYINIKKINVDADFYRSILISYIFLSAFFFLMFSARFSDRFGFLAWMFIPFLLMPYTNVRQKIGVFNTLTVYLICIVFATIFKFI